MSELNAIDDIARLLGKPKKRLGRPRGARDLKPRKLRADRATVGNTLGAHHARGDLNGWPACMTAARLARPSCEHILADGRRCPQPQLKNETHCHHHLKLISPTRMAERDHAERIRLQTFVIDRLATPSKITRAMQTIVAIEKRELRRQWQAGIWELPGSTLRLNPGEDEAVRRRLLKAGVDIASGGISPRTVDYLRWASFDVLRNSIDEPTFTRRVARRLKEEAKWREKGSSPSQHAQTLSPPPEKPSRTSAHSGTASST